MNFGMVSFGKAEVMLNMHGKPAAHDVSLWFYTDQIDNLYQLLKSRQLEAAQAALAGEPADRAGSSVNRTSSACSTGARQFCIRDLNGTSCTSYNPTRSRFMNAAGVRCPEFKQRSPADTERPRRQCPEHRITSRLRVDASAILSRETRLHHR